MLQERQASQTLQAKNISLPNHAVCLMNQFCHPHSRRILGCRHPESQPRWGRLSNATAYICC